MKKTLCIDYLKECIEYDPETGLMFWKNRPEHHFKTHRGYVQTNARQTKKPAFNSKHSAGYLHGALDGKKFFAHRIAWALHYGSFPLQEIDHINHDRTDNRISNLRDASRFSNGKNLSKKSSNKTGIIGVHILNKTKKFIAQIRVNNKSIHLGTFTNLQDAALARKIAEKQHGFHQNHGI